MLARQPLAAKEHGQLPAPAHIDDAIVERLLARNTEAWESFLTAYYDAFASCVRAALRRGGLDPSRRDTDEWIAGGMAYFYEKCPQGLRDVRSEGELRGLLFGVVRNFVREEQRRHRRAHDARVELESAPPARSGDVVSDRPELHDAVLDCLAGLPSLYRRALHLRYFGDTRPTYAELSTICGVKAETVKKRHDRGLRLLKECVTRRRASEAGDG